MKEADNVVNNVMKDKTHKKNLSKYSDAKEIANKVVKNML